MVSGGEADRLDFFISHAGADQQWAEWIGQQLTGAGYTVELDVWQWAAGTNFVEAMRAALDRADRVLAVYTDAYFARPFAQAEHHGAFTTTVTSRPGRLVPVLVEHCQVPELYAPLVRIDLAGLDRDEARRRLLVGVAAPPGPPPDPVGFPGPAGLLPAAEVEFPRRLPPVWNVPPRNPFFTGRTSLLDTVHDRLRRPVGEPVAVVPLQGMGGIGKTQLTVEYAHRHTGDYRLVWWVSADNPTLATTGLIDLAAALSLPTDGPPATVLRLLWAALGERTDWLLIYDNVDDPAALAGLRPPESGRLLLTSRNPTLGRMAALIEVAEFDRAESVALLQRRCPTLTDAHADQIAAAVGDLPLAVEQAGCFLAETGLNVADYLHLLATQPQQAGLADPTIEQHPGLVAVVTASHTRLRAASPTAAALLDQLAFCAPEPLPLTPRRALGAPAETIGRFGVQVGDIATTATVVRHITGLGLARHTGTNLQAHRLVQALLRARLSPAEQTRTRRAARQLLATATPGDPNDPASWPAYATLTPHFQALTDPPHDDPDDPDAEPEQFRALLLASTRYLHTSGQNLTGRHLAEAAHRRWTRTLGPDHPHTQKAANNLAIYLRSLGDLAGARTLQEDTHARFQRLLGDDHPDTLQAANNLANCLQALGDAAGARALHEDILARFRRLLGDDHPDTLRSASNVASSLWVLGDAAGARALHEDILARRRRVLGPDHPNTLHSANNLAVCLRSLGDAAGARALDADILARRRRVLGPDHPNTLRSANNLAEDLRDLGDLAGARTLQEDTHARYRRLLGDDHPDTLHAANNLANCLQALGDAAAARTLHEDTLTRYRQLLGDDHPNTLASANNLAVCLRSLGDAASARALHEDILARFRRLLGDDHPDTLASANNLANCLQALGDHDAARALLEDTLTRRRRVLGNEHPDTRATFQQLADPEPHRAKDL